MATKTSSTVVIHAGEHLFKIVGHSLIKGGGTRVVTSAPFRVGDHDWTIRYYPNGDSRVTDGQYTSIYLQLQNAGEGEEVTTVLSFCLQDPASPATEEKNKVSFNDTKFSSARPSKGTPKFVSKADLAASGCLKDDCLVIKCVVELATKPTAAGDEEDDDEDTTVAVPPSNLSQDFGSLLASGLAADMTVKVGWFKKFKVHRCVLAARSPVFRAQLCGSMIERNRSSIRVDDMDARVFEALLHYMYNDTLPEFMEEDQAAGDEAATNMAQHLFVAADRYAMERLKLMCESKLSKALDVRTVGFTLDFAERHHCRQLKDCCLEYVVGDAERMKAIVKTEGFMQLKQNYPLVACEILDKVAEKL